MSKISLLHVKLKALVKTRGHDRRPLQATCYMTLLPVSFSHFIAGASFKLSASVPLRHDLGTVSTRQRVYLFIEQLCRFAHGTAKSTEITLKQVNRKPLLEGII